MAEGERLIDPHAESSQIALVFSMEREAPVADPVFRKICTFELNAVYLSLALK